GHRRVPDETQHEPVHPHMMPGEQHLHREPIAFGDPADQDFIRGRLVRAQRSAHRLVAGCWDEVQRKGGSRSFYLNPTKLPQNPPLACGSVAGYGSLAGAMDAKMPPKAFVLQAFPLQTKPPAGRLAA